MMCFVFGRLSRWPAGSIGWPKPVRVPRLPLRPGFYSRVFLSSRFPTAVFDFFSFLKVDFPPPQGVVCNSQKAHYRFLKKRAFIDSAVGATFFKTCLDWGSEKVCLLGSWGGFFRACGKMDAGIEKECSALGGLFQLIMNDMKVRNKIKHNLLSCLKKSSQYI